MRVMLASRTSSAELLLHVPPWVATPLGDGERKWQIEPGCLSLPLRISKLSAAQRDFQKGTSLVTVSSKSHLGQEAACWKEACTCSGPSLSLTFPSPLLLLCVQAAAFSL